MRTHLGTGLLVSPVVVLLALGCATQEDENFGDPAKVAGGLTGDTATSTTSSTGGACETDPSCSVSFATDIFAGIIETSSCTTTGLCHGAPTAAGGLLLDSGKPSDGYDAIKSFTMKEGGSYVVACDPAASKILCNTLLDEAAGENPYGPLCGTGMPSAPIAPLGKDQLDNLVKWIECGAPDN